MEKIAIIAGAKEIPLILGRELGKRNIDFIVVGFNEFTDFQRLEKLEKKIYRINLTKPFKIFKILKQEKIEEIIFIGKIPKHLILAKKAPVLKYLNVLKGLSDSKIYKLIIREVERRGIKIEKQTKYLKNYIAGEGVVSGRSPGKNIYDDIRFGYRIAKRIAGLEIGQTVIVKNGTVVAVEAMEGTDETIKRAGKMNIKEFVVVKVAKSGLDERFDVPVVGLKTIMNIINSGGSALAVEAKRTFIINKDRIGKLCKENRFSVVGAGKNL